MDKFIRAYPGVAVALGGMAVILLGFLLTYPLYSINDSIEQIRVDMKNIVAEYKEDRKDYQKELIGISSRVTVLESRCEPLYHRNGINPTLNK